MTRRKIDINVLVGCEESGIIRDAFRRRGYNAVSCDVKPTRSFGPHFMGDIRDYDMRHIHCLIVHPDCTFLCSSGLHWNTKDPSRERKTKQAVQFVRWLLARPVPYIALENPVGRVGTAIRPADQYIQPYEFGDDASKRTGLWLKGLPKLEIDPKRYFPPRMLCPKCETCSSLLVSQIHKGCPNCGAEEGLLKPRWSNQTDSGQNRLGPGENRARDRSQSYQGIAQAMSLQWGDFLEKNL